MLSALQRPKDTEHAAKVDFGRCCDQSVARLLPLPRQPRVVEVGIPQSKEKLERVARRRATRETFPNRRSSPPPPPFPSPHPGHSRHPRPACTNDSWLVASTTVTARPVAAPCSMRTRMPPSNTRRPTLLSSADKGSSRRYTSAWLRTMCGGRCGVQV
eukprot:366233-Chlamydomonas_euryale.AAC.4